MSDHPAPHDPDQGFAGCRAELQVKRMPPRFDRSQSRRFLVAIDDCLDALERLHASGQSSRSACGIVIAALRSTTLEPRAAVLAAPDTFGLHEALLDWQEDVLEVVLSRRREAHV